MTIGYDPPKRGRVIPMAVHQDEAHADVKMVVHEADLLKGPEPKGGLKPISVNHHVCVTCIVRQE